LADGFMMYTVATITVFVYEIYHRVFHCALYVRHIGSVLGFEN